MSNYAYNLISTRWNLSRTNIRKYLNAFFLQIVPKTVYEQMQKDGYIEWEGTRYLIVEAPYYDQEEIDSCSRLMLSFRKSKYTPSVVMIDAYRKEHTDDQR